MTFICPACGYPELDEPMRDETGEPSWEICPCCGFQSGVTDDDRGFTYESWRQRWIAGGMKWWAGEDEPAPPGWDPKAQLQRLLDNGLA